MNLPPGHPMPWTPGLPQAHCAACDENVVACTLDSARHCANCAAGLKPRTRRNSDTGDRQPRRRQRKREPTLALFDLEPAA